MQINIAYQQIDVEHLVLALFEQPKEIEFEEQRRISKKYFTSWFQYHLRNFDEYFTYIFGEEAQNDLENGILSSLTYNY